MALFSIEKKPVLEVTPLFHIWTIFMSFAFMYTFTLEYQAEYLFRGLEIFRWLYVIGFILMFLNVDIRDQQKTSKAVVGWIVMWTFIGVMGIALINIFGSMFAKMSGVMPMSQVAINYGVFDDLGLALLAGYNEEIAFTALYFAIDRLVPDTMRVRISISTVLGLAMIVIGLFIGLFGIVVILAGLFFLVLGIVPKSVPVLKAPLFSVSLSHVVTLWVTAMLFPLYHIVAYNIWGYVFVVLFMGRLLLEEILIQSRYIEPAIGAHAIWDCITIIPALFIGG